MSVAMPAIQEMPEEDAPESLPTSPRAGTSPRNGTVVSPRLSSATNGDAFTDKQEEPVAVTDPKASKFSLADGEDPKSD